MHDLLSGPRPFGQKGNYKLEYCSVADGGSVDILPTVSGSGLIDFIWIACHYGNQIDMYVDGETNPSIGIPAQRFFAAEYVDTQPAFAGPWFSGNGADGGIGVGGFLPIPFSTSIRVKLTNKSGLTITIWSEVTYLLGIENVWPFTQQLHVCHGFIDTIASDTIISLVDVSNTQPGRMAGFYWLLDSFPGRARPEAAPLEGNFRLYLDGSADPIVESSGSEDEFLMSGYFNKFSPPTIAGDIGLTIKTDVTWAAYRMFIKDPIFFHNGLRFTWQNGETSHVRFTGTTLVGWCVWYYTQKSLAAPLGPVPRPTESIFRADS